MRAREEARRRRTQNTRRYEGLSEQALLRRAKVDLDSNETPCLKVIPEVNRGLARDTNGVIISANTEEKIQRQRERYNTQPGNVIYTDGSLKDIGTER
ncbi:hypothetical protein BX616_008886, partial [Lobosporangium transversale]